MGKKLQFILNFLLFLILSLPLFSQSIPTDSLYLGQTPPGNTPKIFNLSVSDGLRAAERIAITSDGKEIFYGELNTYPPTNQRVKRYQYINDKWEGPTIVFEGYNSPRLSPNDSTIFIQKHVNGMSYTYYSNKTNNGWSVPKKFYSKNQQTHYLQKTDLNNYYVSTNLPGSSFQRDICKLIITDNDTVFQSLETPINTSNDEADFFISKDESYIIFSRSITASDMFISFKTTEDKWTDPVKLEAPISKSDPNWEYGDFVSPDGKYLFFTRGGNYMSSYYTYWVKIDNIIDSLKSELVGVEKAELPENFKLQQNYPNPFNPETNINFTIGESGNVKLTLYNVLGQKVKELINKEMNTGNYTISVDGSELSSGIYFYRMITNNFSEVKKMMLLK